MVLDAPTGNGGLGEFLPTRRNLADLAAIDTIYSGLTGGNDG